VPQTKHRGERGGATRGKVTCWVTSKEGKTPGKRELSRGDVRKVLTKREKNRRDADQNPRNQMGNGGVNREKKESIFPTKTGEKKKGEEEKWKSLRRVGSRKLSVTSVDILMT